MSVLGKDMKERIAQAVENVLLRWSDGNPEKLERSCLIWSTATVDLLKHQGVRAILQAGSVRFRVVSPENDNGIDDNAFAYEWSPDEPLSAARLAVNGIPEMHVWVAIPDANEVIDMTTRYIHKLAAERGIVCDRPWPRYIWTSLEKAWEFGAQYSANLEACIFAEKLDALIRTNVRSGKGPEDIPEGYLSNLLRDIRKQIGRSTNFQSN